ncbi:GNAT family N-acetyltransferase [uncultured Algibacter sp.]|uniref:GNAT family N-acetyltransferase n=1 Tax=uncultured Algibacter sp. TaxID=298659 RepID=UPI002627F0C3|nr:GNAT family N-acetyltransferase [uncultured Algibacter sp.]
MIKLLRTDSNNIDFVYLVKKLDSYLKIIDGDDHSFYNQFNNIDVLKHVVVAYNDAIPVGCGAFKMFNNNSVEIKRMFTLPASRGQKIASKILNELEHWAKELKYTSCILETGKRQVAAVNFYSNQNYNIIPNFGPYKNIENSVCFEKQLSPWKKIINR